MRERKGQDTRAPARTWADGITDTEVGTPKGPLDGVNSLGGVQRPTDPTLSRTEGAQKSGGAGRGEGAPCACGPRSPRKRSGVKPEQVWGNPRDPASRAGQEDKGGGRQVGSRAGTHGRQGLLASLGWGRWRGAGAAREPTGSRAGGVAGNPPPRLPLTSVETPLAEANGVPEGRTSRVTGRRKEEEGPGNSEPVPCSGELSVGFSMFLFCLFIYLFWGGCSG